MPEDFQHRIAVDLDGVLAQYDGWEGMENIGDPIPGAAAFMDRLRDQGYYVLVWTTRMNPNPFDEDTARHAPGEALSVVEGWLEEHGIPYDEVYDGRGKPIASAYVDNRAVSCSPDGHRNASAEFSAALAHLNDLVG